MKMPLKLMAVIWALGTAQLLAAPKNVVLIVADDLGLDLGCYGNRAIRTPHLDSIAADGTLFTHAFCTTASCSPSRSVILTGLHNHANGQYGLQHATHHFSSFSNIRSLSQRLHDANYRTARIGKFHVAPEEVYPFEFVLQGDPRNAVEMAQQCREVVSADDPRPFFLYFCTADPHRSGKFGDAKERPNLFGNEARHEGVVETTYDPKDVVVPSFLPDTLACRAELAQYYQAVSRVDQGVGRLVQVLRDAGHWNDTLLFFISDNGVPFPGAKTTEYDSGTRLPCLVRNPYTARRPVRSDALASWVDITPTILDFAGVPIKDAKLHGRSLLGILDQKQPAGWDEVFASHTFHEATMYYPMRVVRTRQYKLIWNIAHALPFPFASDLYRSATWQDALSKDKSFVYGKRSVSAYINRPQFELYDLDRDPDEVANLAAEPQHAPLLEKLKEKLKDFQARTADPWLHKWEYE